MPLAVEHFHELSLLDEVASVVTCDGFLGKVVDFEENLALGQRDVLIYDGESFAVNKGDHLCFDARYSN